MSKLETKTIEQLEKTKQARKRLIRLAEKFKSTNKKKKTKHSKLSKAS